MFYNVFKFAPEQAGRTEFHYTLKHWSWLNVAVSELSRQCMRGWPIADSEELRLEVGVRVTNVDARRCGARYQMTVADARRELKLICPLPIVL